MAVKRHFQPLVFLLVALLSYGLFKYTGHGNTAVTVQLPKIQFYDKLDHAVTLDDFKGQLVLVNLWASWCLPCIEEMPSLARLQKKLPANKFRIVAIATDQSSAPEIRKFLDARGAKNLDVYRDKDRQIPLKWKYEGLPTSFLLDREGRIIKQYNGGYRWDTAALVEEIRASLL
ncbi:MAG: redoxin family protein [Proteobacteria bacterium]|nr:redoxin family protein [Pseudomonadota bacterium]